MEIAIYSAYHSKLPSTPSSIFFPVTKNDSHFSNTASRKGILNALELKQVISNTFPLSISLHKILN